jgi:quercetin dioxygenase-like cupin family protein
VSNVWNKKGNSTIILSSSYYNQEISMFTKNEDREYKKLVDGVQMKTLVWGTKTSLSMFELQKGAAIPAHSHPNEQSGYLVSGKLVFIIEGERFEANPGDGWNLESNVEHGAEVLEDAVVVEVFSPIREDYMP